MYVGWLKDTEGKRSRMLLQNCQHKLIRNSGMISTTTNGNGAKKYNQNAKSQNIQLTERSKHVNMGKPCSEDYFVI